MKVLMLNGSPHKNGNTFTALSEIQKELGLLKIDSEIFQIGLSPIRDCTGCRGCKKTGFCVYDDDVVNAFLRKAKEADGFVFGSPTYYAHPSGRILSLLDRVFYSNGKMFAYKPYASVAVARRGGTSTTFDVLNKYATVSNMILIGASYWNNVFGALPGEAEEDEEGLQTMRNIARNMSYVLRLIENGKEHGILPSAYEHDKHTNFIRPVKKG